MPDDGVVDARSLPDDPAALGAALETGVVFGRMTPEQKQAMVLVLQALGQSGRHPPPPKNHNHVTTATLFRYKQPQPAAEDVSDGRAIRNSKVLVVGFALFALVLLYMAFGMPGMDHSAPSGSMPGMAHAAGSMSWSRQNAGEFAATVEGERFVVVNVHTPEEGSIAGTDLTIRYDEILQAAALPADRATPLALYCRSGSMSRIDAQALVDAGYTQIVELEGGVVAWEQAGRSLQRRVAWIEIAAAACDGRRSPLSSSALTATRKLEPDMVRAAISGRSTKWKAGSNTPAAIGRAIAL